MSEGKAQCPVAGCAGGRIRQGQFLGGAELFTVCHTCEGTGWVDLPEKDSGLSPCCKTAVRVAGEGSTHWYECMKCGKPCDPIP